MSKNKLVAFDFDGTLLPFDSVKRAEQIKKASREVTKESPLSRKEEKQAVNRQMEEEIKEHLAQNPHIIDMFYELQQGGVQPSIVTYSGRRQDVECYRELIQQGVREKYGTTIDFPLVLTSSSRKDRPEKGIYYVPETRETDLGGKSHKHKVNHIKKALEVTEMGAIPPENVTYVEDQSFQIRRADQEGYQVVGIKDAGKPNREKVMKMAGIIEKKPEDILQELFSKGKVAEALEMLEDDPKALKAFFEKVDGKYPFEFVPKTCNLQSHKADLLGLIKSLEPVIGNESDNRFLEKMQDRFENKYEGVGLENLVGGGRAIITDANGGMQERMLYNSAGKPVTRDNYFLQGEDVGGLAHLKLGENREKFVGALDKNHLDPLRKQVSEMDKTEGERRLFAFNRGGNHWVAGMLISTDRGIKLLVEDTMAEPDDKLPSALKKFVTRMEKKGIQIEVVPNNTEVQQKDDKHSCGDRTVENLVRFSKLEAKDIQEICETKDGAYVSPPMTPPKRSDLQEELKQWKEEGYKNAQQEREQEQLEIDVLKEMLETKVLSGTQPLLERIGKDPDNAQNVRIFMSGQENEEALKELQSQLKESGIESSFERIVSKTGKHVDVVLKIPKEDIRAAYERENAKTELVKEEEPSHQKDAPRKPVVFNLYGDDSPELVSEKEPPEQKDIPGKPGVVDLYGDDSPEVAIPQKTEAQGKIDKAIEEKRIVEDLSLAPEKLQEIFDTPGLVTKEMAGYFAERVKQEGVSSNQIKGLDELSGVPSQQSSAHLGASNEVVTPPTALSVGIYDETDSVSVSRYDETDSVTRDLKVKLEELSKNPHDRRLTLGLDTFVRAHPEVLEEKNISDAHKELLSDSIDRVFGVETHADYLSARLNQRGGEDGLKEYVDKLHPPFVKEAVINRTREKINEFDVPRNAMQRFNKLTLDLYDEQTVVKAKTISDFDVVEVAERFVAASVVSSESVSTLTTGLMEEWKDIEGGTEKIKEALNKAKATDGITSRRAGRLGAGDKKLEGKKEEPQNKAKDTTGIVSDQTREVAAGDKKLEGEKEKSHKKNKESRAMKMPASLGEKSRPDAMPRKITEEEVNAAVDNLVLQSFGGSQNVSEAMQALVKEWGGVENGIGKVKDVLEKAKATEGISADQKRRLGAGDKVIEKLQKPKASGLERGNG